MQIPVTAATAAASALLLVALAIRVSLLRVRHGVALGDGGNAELLRAIRAHANTVEFVPMFVLLSLCYELVAGAGTVLVGLDALFVLARLSFAYGLSRRAVHPLRRIGAGLSYLTLLALALLLAGAVISRF